jgi:hypothetical protein
MTKTPTLRVSADFLDLKAAPPLPGSLPGGSGKRGEIAPAPSPHSGQASDWEEEEEEVLIKDLKW